MLLFDGDRGNVRLSTTSALQKPQKALMCMKIYFDLWILIQLQRTWNISVYPGCAHKINIFLGIAIKSFWRDVCKRVRLKTSSISQTVFGLFMELQSFGTSACRFISDFVYLISNCQLKSQLPKIARLLLFYKPNSLLLIYSNLSSFHSFHSQQSLSLFCCFVFTTVE